MEWVSEHRPPRATGCQIVRTHQHYERWLHRWFYRKKITFTSSSMQWQHQELELYVATLHFSSRCCILPDCLGAVMSLTRRDEPIKTSCQHHHCHDDGDDGIGDGDHDHSQDCDDATADATWHSWYCQLLCHSQMAPMITACIWATASKWSKEITHLSLQAIIVLAE